MQLLIIWIQLELSMRQQFLYRSQFIPILTLKVLSKTILVESGENSRETETITITVRNLSDNPAFNVMLSRILSDDYTPLEPRMWTSVLRCNIIDHLGPRDEKQLCTTTANELEQLLNNTRVLEVSYVDKYGEWHSTAFTINKNKKTGKVEIITIPYLGKLEEVGILLPLFNTVVLYFRSRRVLRKLKTKKREVVN
ncbi:MAG: hypothetical protein J7L82_02230 [Staphylothermus sp.]|nr:hypothetical protein [Staphylothermus sp.]